MVAPARWIALLALLLVASGVNGGSALLPHALGELPRAGGPPGPGAVEVVDPRAAPFPTDVRPTPSGVRTIRDLPNLPTSPVLDTLDRNAQEVPVGGSLPLDAEPGLWTAGGFISAPEATLNYSVVPTTLGTVSGGTFVAGDEPGSGWVEVVASWNGTQVENQAPLVVYRPVCLLLTDGLSAETTLLPGTNLTTTAQPLDQLGSGCSASVHYAWSLWPASFGSLLDGNTSTVTVVPTGNAPAAFLNVSGEWNGTTRVASSVIDLAPAQPDLLQVNPGSLDIMLGGFEELVARAVTGDTLAAPGSFAWGLSPSDLGSLSPAGGGYAYFTAGEGPATGVIYANFTTPTGQLLTEQVPVTVYAPPLPLKLAGAYSYTPTVGSLFPGGQYSLSAFGLDPYGGLLENGVSVTWSVTPSSLASILGTGSYVTLQAGDQTGDGVATAQLTQVGGPTLDVPFPFSVVPAELSSVLLFGAPSSQMSEGQSVTLGGVPQDTFGNLLLGGSYYDFEYPGVNVSWSVSPSDLGSVAPYDGETGVLDEYASFTAGTVPANGSVVETLAWSGQSWTVDFPVQVVATYPAAFSVTVPGGAGPFGTVDASSTVSVGSEVLDDAGKSLGALGNVTWTLAAGSDATLKGALTASSLALKVGVAAGWVGGTARWSYRGLNQTVGFLFSVAETPAASALGISPGGPTSSVDTSVNAGAQEDVPSPLLVPANSTFTLGTTAVPGAVGPITWSTRDPLFGQLGSATGAEVNISVASTPGATVISADQVGPDGVVLAATLVVESYAPRLTALEVVTGPCSASCSLGEATFTGNRAYLAVLALDQVGNAVTEATWAASVNPSGLASASTSPWDLGSAYALVTVTTGFSAGLGQINVTASWQGTSLPLLVPLEVVPSPALPSLPGAPVDVRAQAGNTEVNLTWSPDPQGTVPTGYIVDWGNASGGLPSGVLPVGNFTQAQVGDLPDGVLLQFEVIAQDAQGSSVPSAPVLALPQRLAPSAPWAVSTLSTADTITVVWTPPLSSGTGTVAGYVVAWGSGGQWDGSARTGPLSVTYTVTGLAPGVSYAFRVQALSDQGLASPWSPEANATLLPQVTTPVSPGTWAFLLGALGLGAAAAALISRKPPRPERPAPRPDAQAAPTSSS